MIHEDVYTYFDRMHGGMEYALIELSRPVASLREEARDYLGKDYKVTNNQAREVLKELMRGEHPSISAKVPHKNHLEKYLAIGAGDFITYMTIFSED